MFHKYPIIQSDLGWLTSLLSLGLSANITPLWRPPQQTCIEDQPYLKFSYSPCNVNVFSSLIITQYVLFIYLLFVSPIWKTCSIKIGTNSHSYFSSGKYSHRLVICTQQVFVKFISLNIPHTKPFLIQKITVYPFTQNTNTQNYS